MFYENVFEYQKSLRKWDYLWKDIILSPAKSKKWRENNETLVDALRHWKELTKETEEFQANITELTDSMMKERSMIDENDIEGEFEFVSKYSLFLFIAPLTGSQMEAHTIVLEMITRLVLNPEIFRTHSENLAPSLTDQLSRKILDVFHFQLVLNEKNKASFLLHPGYIAISATLTNSPVALCSLFINYFNDHVEAFPISCEMCIKFLTVKDPEFNKDWSWIYSMFDLSALTRLLFLLVGKESLKLLLQAHQQLIFHYQHSPHELEQLMEGLCNAFQCLSVKYDTRKSNSYGIYALGSYWCKFSELFDYFLTLKRGGLSEISMEQLATVFTKVVLVPYLCGDPIPCCCRSIERGRIDEFIFSSEVEGSGYFDLQEFMCGRLRDHEISPLILQSLTNQLYNLFSDTSKIPSGFRYEHLLYLPYEFFRRDDHHLKTFHDITKYVAHRLFTETGYYNFRWDRTGQGERLSWYFSEDGDNRSHARLIMEDIWLKNTNNNSNKSNSYLAKVYKDLMFLRNHKWNYLVHEIKDEELFFIVFHDMMNNLKPRSDLLQLVVTFLDQPLQSEILNQLIHALVTVCIKPYRSNSFSNLPPYLQSQMQHTAKLECSLLFDFLDKNECSDTFYKVLVQDILMERFFVTTKDSSFSGPTDQFSSNQGRNYYVEFWNSLESYKKVQELIFAEYALQIIDFGANNSNPLTINVCFENFTNVPAHYFQVNPTYLSVVQHLFANITTFSMKGYSKLIEIHYIKEGKYKELASLLTEILTLLFAFEEVKSTKIFELLEELYCVEEGVMLDNESCQIVEKCLCDLTEGFKSKEFSCINSWNYQRNQLSCYLKSFSERSPYGIVATFITNAISLSLTRCYRNKELNDLKPYSDEKCFSSYYYPPRNNPWLERLYTETSRSIAPYYVKFIPGKFKELKDDLSLPLIENFVELLSKNLFVESSLEESVLQEIYLYCSEIKMKYQLSPDTSQLAGRAKDFKIYVPDVLLTNVNEKKSSNIQFSSVLDIFRELYLLMSLLMHDLCYAKEKYVNYLPLKINFDEAISFLQKEVKFRHNPDMSKREAWLRPCSYPPLQRLLDLKQKLLQLLSLPPIVTELIDKLWPIPLLPHYFKKGLDEAEKEYPEKDQFFHMEKAGRYAEFIFKGMLRRPPNGSDEMVKVFQAFGQDFHIKDAFSNGEDEDAEAHFDVFLSHSWADHDLVSELNKKLKAEGIRTFFDEDRLREDMRDHLATALYKSKFFILFLSEDYNRKVGRKDSTDYCYYEFNAFSSRKDLKHILPVVLNDSLLSIDNWCDRLQAELRTKLYVNLSANHEIEGKYQKLLKRIKKMLNDDDDESLPILPSSPSTQETTENGQSLIIAKEEVSGDEIAHLNGNTVQKAEDSLHLQPFPSPSLPQDFETAWACLAEKNRKNPDKLRELLDEWGVETAADLKYLTAHLRMEMANLLKVVPRGKFLEALGLQNL